ncbi:CopG family ribbon-helix-helix protein [Rhodoferax sp.]|uniref:CopG family ribbon-helix-helix protein n=1 Tax=Rhodoferax sp. TaxID=50421 RepID=UPI002723A036|nr:CopG family transcriptional regulator [Rhodoferax sp.]MDO8317755.1 CopG family transcriptional regulator [Rhodoferax sp.]MDP2677201.1 CopG family transcriptional regulator [Rhodoferax sp.]
MQTTTIRLDDTMKERIAAAANHAGKSAHAFILDAISQTVEQVELDNEFNAKADERWKGILASGQTIPWADAQAYLTAKLRGENPSKPLARSANH